MTRIDNGKNIQNEFVFEKNSVIILIFTVFFTDFSVFAIDRLDSKILEAKKDLKSGAQHIHATVTKNGKIEYRLEFFRYTDLDEVIPSLRFEKDPNKFVKDTYEKNFKIIENCLTTIGAFAGTV